MRHEKAGALIELAVALAGSAEGLTLDQMAAVIGTGRRTVERMRDALWELFPLMEELDDPPTKRFRIQGGLRRMFVTPADREMAALKAAIELAQAAGSRETAAGLVRLSARLEATRPPAAKASSPVVSPRAEPASPTIPAHAREEAARAPLAAGEPISEVGYLLGLKQRLRSWQNVSAATGRNVETLQRLCST